MNRNCTRLKPYVVLMRTESDMIIVASYITLEELRAGYEMIRGCAKKKDGYISSRIH